jgi:predicted GNAT family N-acyltransferase
MISNKIDFKVIDHWSKEYRKAIYLRYKLLRQPLGLKFSSSQFAEEQNQIQITGALGDEIIAVLLFIPYPDMNLRMRQVAVKKELQGQGIGKNLVLFAEKHARQQGYKKIFLHARDSVIPFYKQLHYKVTGNAFIEVGIPHHKMEKTLL